MKRLIVMGVCLICVGCAGLTPINYYHEKYGIVTSKDERLIFDRKLCAESYFAEPRQMGEYQVESRSQAIEILVNNLMTSSSRANSTIYIPNTVSLGGGKTMTYSMPVQIQHPQPKSKVYVSEEFDAAYGQMDLEISNCIQEKGWELVKDSQ